MNATIKLGLSSVVLMLAGGLAAYAPVASAQSSPIKNLSIDARGNWMREYVQLRVAERNLQAGIDTLAEAEQKPPFQTRIVGGTVAGSADNPFQVALLNRSIANNFDAFICGGTLVKANMIVTAAHCSDFVTAGQVQVLTGTRNLDGTGVRRNVTRIAIHPNWNRNTYDYDVAVWTLSSSTSGIPFASLANAHPADGTNLLVTGWGALSQGGSFPINLRKATVPLVNRVNCNDANSYNGLITLRMMCAGFDAGGRDACQDDSGGPLAQGSVLTGIVSWGSGCALPNKYGVYTRVSNLLVRNFLRAQTGL